MQQRERIYSIKKFTMEHYHVSNLGFISNSDQQQLSTDAKQTLFECGMQSNATPRRLLVGAIV